MVAATRQASPRNSLYLRNLPSANKAGRSANLSAERKNPDHKARCTKAPKLLDSWRGIREKAQRPREHPRTPRKVYIRCAIGVLTHRRSVEIKINGSEAGVIKLEASSCHFVRKERRNSMGRLTS